MTSIGVVGAGRAGVGLALALHRAGHVVRLHARRGKDVPPPLVLTWGGAAPWLPAVEVVLLAVRDGAIEDAARELAATDAVRDAHVVMHLSGLLDDGALAALRPTGAALGCFHPLQALARAEDAPTRLRGAVAALSGDERAVATGTRLATSLGMQPVRLPGAAKPAYHAAAAIASNYLVILHAAAERLMTDAGVGAAEAREGVAALMAGTLANARTNGPAALTGPIVRGDVATVRAHLAALPPDLQDMYRALGRVALTHTRLPEPAAGELRSLLGA